LQKNIDLLDTDFEGGSVNAWACDGLWLYFDINNGCFRGGAPMEKDYDVNQIIMENGIKIM
jgi:hypothetical protein